MLTGKAISSAVLAGALLLGAPLWTGKAGAAERYHDRIYADSFGNLVVLSRSGYKRIVVGKGHLAEELADYSGARDTEEPRVIVLDEYNNGTQYRDGCYRPPVLVKGRSYMYGLDEGELPELAGHCPRR